MQNINKKTLLKFYSYIFRIRTIELSIAKNYSKNIMRTPVHLSVGQEAVAVGVCINLKKKDKIFSAHRSHAHYLAKGGSLNKMIAELHGKKNGCTKGIGGSMHLMDLNAGLVQASPIIGSSISIALGYAWSNLLQNKNIITVVFFGEGATETGIFHESLNFASLHNIPILFVCENNFYSVNSSLSVRQSKARSLRKNVESFGINFSISEGNNIAKNTINYIYTEKKPAFLSFNTYRFLEHCGPNDDQELGYRNKKEILYWEKKCPLKNLKRKIINSKNINLQELQFLEDKIKKEIKTAFIKSSNSDYLEPKHLKNLIYSI